MENKTEKSAGMSSAGLKWLAMAVMTADHVGVVFAGGTLYAVLRLIGRGAFPIFCFLIVEGAVHTRRRGKYALRLALCGVISEPVFDWVFHRSFLCTRYQNVMWTLLLGLLCVYSILQTEEFCRNNTEKRGICAAAGCGCAAVCLFLVYAAEMLHTDYGGYGVMLIAGFGLLRRQRPAQCVFLGMLSFLRGVPQAYAVWSAVPILLYNGEKGHSSRWMYAYYPVHMAVLGLVAALLQHNLYFC